MTGSRPDQTLGDGTSVAALATAPQAAGLAIIRMSGPLTRGALGTLFQAKKDPVNHPRELVYGSLLDHKTREIIDRALAVFMPAPRSFTGEDVVELQFHGSMLLVQKILRSLYAFGFAPAEPGEFTKRAFLNGKLDLVQAEAIADLISARTDRALKLAGEHLKGRFSGTIQEIGEPLRDALAELEASIDFVDEQIEPQAITLIAGIVQAARERIIGLLSSYSYGQIVRDGFRVLLCGQPNVGKSSILNQLLGKQRAIVSHISGTTRDIIEEEAIISGYKFVFCDCAGICDSSDLVEKMGVELSKERVPWADLVLLVTDASDSTQRWREVLKLIHPQAKKLWLVVNKIDLAPHAIGTVVCESSVCSQTFYVSTLAKDGLKSLFDALVEEVSNSLGGSADSSNIIVNERQRNCLSLAATALTRALDAVAGQLPTEIIATDVRSALNALEEIVGKTYTDDILGRIFSKFCVGK